MSPHLDNLLDFFRFSWGRRSRGNSSRGILKATHHSRRRNSGVSNGGVHRRGEFGGIGTDGREFDPFTLEALVGRQEVVARFEWEILEPL